jgi:homoserine kinase
MKRVTAFAPATVANVAVGFDLLGFAQSQVGDEVTLIRIERPTIEITSITQADGASLPMAVSTLPREPEANTATVGLLRLIKDLRLDFGFQVELKKKIPLSSGMGGSAASAVGAIVAANEFLRPRLPKEKLLAYALMGEAVASGAAHADNISPCLFGGLTLTKSVDPLEVIAIPVPENILCVLVHPNLKVDTKMARGILRPEISLKDHVRQSANLAGFISGCFLGDTALIGKSLADLIVEPQRASLVPSFLKAKEQAMRYGALGCSFSGSGPSLFAWASSPESAAKIRAAIVETFQSAGVEAQSWVSPISKEGASILSKE